MPRLGGVKEAGEGFSLGETGGVCFNSTVAESVPASLLGAAGRQAFHGYRGR